MTDKQEIEIYVCMNEMGDWEVGTDEGDTAQLLSENSGGACARTVRIKAYIAPPEIAEVEVDVPDEAGETVKVEAA